MSAGRIVALIVAIAWAASAIHRRKRLSGRHLLLVATGVVILLVIASGVLAGLPKPDHIVSNIAQALGPWTYLVVGVMAFLERYLG